MQRLKSSESTAVSGNRFVVNVSSGVLDDRVSWSSEVIWKWYV